MIGRTWIDGGEAVRFELQAGDAVSVVGDFNGWDPHAGALDATTDGVRARTFALAPGRYAFRYLDAGGRFFDDPDADLYEPNGHGQVHGVLVVADHVATPETAPPAAPSVAAARHTDAPAEDDEAIRTDVLRSMHGHPYLAGIDVRCEVVGHIVRLRGIVPSRLAKQALWELAWADRRVVDVENGVSILVPVPAPSPVPVPSSVPVSAATPAPPSRAAAKARGRRAPRAHTATINLDERPVASR